ncbi:hypothetical protein LMH87_010577 [Akanthomyces muscarius]|uniref:Uncharacterized protein n=1 Tax=Akanthomyces muscarius TaxID=2231603 RepID=A0A9W8QGX8_AKAMU|nr:hypothetical protein LMH87_010577 [Akanthomyces muscarius]KAJ4154114.1 hypothetical protein LMH87_010577 [Akanthomyces muscarius]
MDKKTEKSSPNESVAEVDVSGDRFLAAAPRRQQILETINATQHAKAALYQTRQDLLTIGDDQDSASEMAQKMKETAEREKKEWTKLKGSKLKKLFHSAEYAAELKKEEDEYYEAYEWQLRAEAAAKEVGEQIATLRKKKSILLKQVEEHRQAQVQLANLYEEVFDGPTPNWPEEDEMEANLAALQETCDTVQGKITHTYHVCEVLAPARRALNTALEAAQNSYDSTLSNIGNMAINLAVDMSKPDYVQPGTPDKRPYKATGGTLEQIRRCLAQADQSMAAAQRLDPSVMAHVLPQIDPENKARHSGRIDRFINAPLTDIIFYQEIDEAGKALETVARVVTEEVDRWDAKLESLREERTPIQEKLKLCREELYELRARLFDDATCPPPQYTDKEAEDEAAKKKGKMDKGGNVVKGDLSDKRQMVVEGETLEKGKQ